MISLSTAVLLLSAAVPAIAMVNTSAVTNRMSRRLLEEKVLSEQRVPEQAVKTSLILQERTVNTEDTTGFSNLSRSRITTRNHTLRGARMRSLTSRPSRRSVIKDAESMLILPPALVQTGSEDEATITTQKLTRRTLIKMTEEANRLGQ